jgi:hypothetical protein
MPSSVVKKHVLDLRLYPGVRGMHWNRGRLGSHNHTLRPADRRIAIFPVNRGQRNNAKKPGGNRFQQAGTALHVCPDGAFARSSGTLQRHCRFRNAEAAKARFGSAEAFRRVGHIGTGQSASARMSQGIKASGQVF